MSKYRQVGRGQVTGYKQSGNIVRIQTVRRVTNNRIQTGRRKTIGRIHTVEGGQVVGYRQVGGVLVAEYSRAG